MGRKLFTQGHIARELAADDAFQADRFCSVVTAAVIGGGATIYAANKSSKAQGKAVDAAKESASEANQLSRDQFDWNKEIYERDVRPAQERNFALQSEVVGEALNTSREQRDFARKQNAYYEQTFKPVEEQMVRDAQNYDSADNINRRSGIAGANVEQAFSGAAQQQLRNFSRAGINPNSSSFARESGNLTRNTALAKAGAMTGAAFDTMDKGIALRAGAANFGRNMPNTAATYFAGGNQSASVAGGAGNSALSSAISGAGFMNSAYNNRINGAMATGGMLANAYGSEASAWGNAAGGLGRITGGLLANGGGFGLGSFGSWMGTTPGAAVSNEVSNLGSSTWNPFSDYNTGRNGWGNYGE